MCKICEAQIDNESGDFSYYFGILPVELCIMCFSNMVDMVKKITLCSCE